MGSIAYDQDRASNELSREPFAIIGIATRFPQEATSTEELWKFLLKGRCAHTPFPSDRLGPGHYHPDPEHGGSYAVKGGHFLSEDPALFDAPFFNITKGEVMALDPQQRVVLENVYHALENAGLPMHEVTGTNTSVFISGFNHDHLAWLNTDPESTMKYKPTGTTNSLLSNRVSWFFDFKSPSVTLDTACSSSMVALHLGCQGLRTGESDMAVISGVTMISFPTDIMSMGHHGFLSQEGRCYSFDHRADGYARGEGVGSLIVKRLSDAVRDGNTIRAVIRGTGVNQDGRTPGVSFPSAVAQEALIRKVYASAGLDLADTMMVEAHGTGTAAGDPVETNALARTFGASRKGTPIYVGAIKSGIGHLEGGAGVAGLIKAVLILESGIIPPNVNFEKVNPKIPLKKWKLQFPLKALPWPVEGLRRISVNSFGVGGTNAHTILDDAYSYLTTFGINALHHTHPTLPTQNEIDQLLVQLKPPTESEAEPNIQENGTVPEADGQQVEYDANATSPTISCTPRITLLTSFDEAGVQRIGQTQAKYLKSVNHSLDLLNEMQHRSFLDDFSYTMARRSQFPWRRHVVASNTSTLISALENIPKPLRVRNTPRVGFVFTGQGAQWYAMGRELMVYPIYRRSIIEANDYMHSIGASWSLLDELSRSKADTNVNEPYLAHPACAALQIALVELLQSWDVVPSRVIGHSSGEIAAAYCAGRLSREAAWKTAYFRGLVSSRQLSINGSMMAVGLSSDAAQLFLDKVKASADGELIIACFNSPKNVTVSGDDRLIDALKKDLEGQSVFARKLQVKNAYHSAHMREVASEYFDSLGTLDGSSSRPDETVHMFSSVTGSRIEDDVLDAQYWTDNLVSPVRFADALSEMCFSRIDKGQASIELNSSGGNTVFADIVLEIGPHGAMQSAIKEVLASTPYAAAITVLNVLNRSSPGLTTMLESVGQLVSRGIHLDLEKINASSDDGASKTRPRTLVELPGYAFNHSERLIYESRLTKNYRLRKEPRHDLFGAPVPDWNKEAPRWRNVLRIEEQPWLRDHIVTNQIVLPGVAYLIAAVEASRQVADPEKTMLGFRLRDISLKRALIIPDNKEGVETMLSLTRYDESSLQASSVWRKFIMSSFNPVSEDWTEHCTGYITVDYDATNNPIDEGLEANEESIDWQKKLEAAKSLCTSPMNIADTYENLVTAGLEFGPLFQNLTEVYGTTSRAGQIFGTITVPDVAASMPHSFMHSHLIHPATMDSFMHFFISSVMDATGKKSLDRPMVPTFIKDVWMSADLNSTPGTKFFGHGRSHLVAYDKYESEIRVWDADTDTARAHISGVRATPLEAISSDTGIRKLNHEIKWVPYLDLLQMSTIQHAETTTNQDDAEYKMWVEKIQTATLLFIDDALALLNNERPPTADGHLARYFEWMQFASEQLKKDEVAGMRLSFYNEHKADFRKRETLLKEVVEGSASGQLAVRMGENIVKVLRKKEDPLRLMFGIDDLLDHVYTEVARLGNLPALQAALLEIIKDNATNLRILEVGAGTGGTTAGILDGLTARSTDGTLSSSIGNYTFTDISSAFFEKAKDKFKIYHNFIDYKVLDIEDSADKQGFDLGSYDIVIAQNVVHATTDLKRTFSHMRALLKPGGKLLLQEGVRQDFFWSTISFGQLSGWWAGVEPIRRMSPWITPGQWDQTMKSAGFAGIELDLPDRESPDLHSQSLFVSTASTDDTTSKAKSPQTAIVTSTPLSEGPNEFCSKLKDHLVQDYGLNDCEIIHYLDLANTKLDHTVCIVTCELENSVLSHLSEDEFTNIRQMLCICKGMMWLTGDVEKNPELGMITGLIRTVRWERDIDEVNLITLTIAEPRPVHSDLVRSIGTLFRQQFDKAMPLQKMNGEFLLKGRVFSTSRLVEAQAADTFLSTQFSRSKPVMTPFKDAGRPIKLATAAPGLLDKLEWVTDDVYFEPLADTHVEIDIKAVAMNFRDLMIAMGEHMAYSMGNEAAGVVSRVGPKVQDVAVGDRVVYLCGLETQGTFHTFGRVDQNVVVKIPDQMSYEVACGLPCVYATVIYGLVDAGRLMRDEKILIHAAAGGVGQAAIHYSKFVGAEIFATVSNPEKRELVRKLGVQDDHIFSSRDLTFVKGIMRMTDGKGVDLVLNSLSGEALRRSWDLLAPFGRFVEIGKKDAQNNGKIELRPFLRNVTFTSVELPTMMRHRPSLVKRLTKDAVRLWTDGSIKEADPMTIMSYSQVEEGLRILQSGRGMGKMIFVPGPDDVLPIVPQQPPAYKLRSDATYVMAGGLGGIGRSFAVWMAQRGARHLLFLSSTGNITSAVSKTLEELELEGCKSSIVKCDVSDKDKLRATIEDCAKTMPPIKGVVQGAMKLKDTMFENMTWDEFQLAVQPKVQGSWNLHEVLPHDMDFFIMLSSATGVLGNRAQSNYAAGNTFQDALAHHRRSLGLPASTLDLGQVLSVGYVAENLDRARVAKHLATVLEVIREDEIHTLLEYLMNPECSPPAQMAAGLTTAELYRHRGMPTPTYLDSPLFTHLRNVTSMGDGDADGEGGIRVEALLNQATTLDEATEIVLPAVRNKLSSLLAVPVEDVDPNKSISSNGVDSLVAMEFRTYLAKEVKADIPVLEIQGTMSLADLSRKIASVSNAVELKEEEKKTADT